MMTACRLFSAWVALAAVAGCAQIPGQPPVVAQCHAPIAGDRPGPALVGQAYGMNMTPIPLNSVQFGSVKAARAIAVQGLFASRSAGDTVRIQARFVSCLDTPAAVRVRTSFVRADMGPAEPASAWKTVHVEPRAIALYEELSTTREAAAYLIEVAE